MAPEVTVAAMRALAPLTEVHPTDPSKITAFRRDGHVAIEGLASPEEVADYRPLLERAALDHAWDTRPISERDTYGKAFLQSFNLWRLDDDLGRFSCSPRFAKVAADLLGVDGVRMYHDQALFKEAGGGRTPWHQDQHYWPLGTAQTVTMWMPLADLAPEVGSMEFVSGTHLEGNLVDLGISDESEVAFEALIAERGWHPETHGALRAGDATFHAGWTLHAARPNPTDAMRPVMTVIYVDAAATVAEPSNDAQQLDLAVWLKGSEPGGPIVGEANPILWPSES